jgi:hypothetical protein
MGKSTAHVIVGSSNLTDDGLRQTGEFNAVFTMKKESKQFHELHDTYETHWQAKSRPLAEDVLHKYEEWRASVEIATQNLKPPLSKILGLNRQPPKPVVERVPTFWRTCIDGHLSDEAEAMLKETTDWERRGYLYFSTWRTAFGIGDRIVLFDLSDRNVVVVEIKETTQTPKRTPDGSHFAAYRRVRGACLRRLVPKRWKSLKLAGLIRLKSDVHMTRKLSAAKFEAFVENLREVAK